MSEQNNTPQLFMVRNNLDKLPDFKIQEGTWQGNDGSIEIGSCIKTVAATLFPLPWYRKINCGGINEES